MRITWVGVPKEKRRELRKQFRAEFADSVELLVCSDRGADQKVRQRIRDDLWAFKTDFILAHSKLNDGNRLATQRGNALRDALAKMQEKLCEDANELVFAILKSFKKFWREAVRADGRGHFLAGYDSRESEYRSGGETFFVYRTN